jgi:glycerophosphoryl diester phosphodiesterase
MLRRITLISVLALLAACGDKQQAATPLVENSAAILPGIDLARLLDCAREQRVTLLQAHRAGDRLGAAENSLAAINASLNDGALFIEIDVARTADGVLVLMHDDTLERTTTGSGLTTESRYAELSTLTLVDLNGRDTGEPIPTLAEALAALEGRGIAQIDRKAPTTFEEIAAIVEASDAVGRSVIITYTIVEAIALHRRLPQVMISTGIKSMQDVDRLKAAEVDLGRITAWLGLGTGNPDLDARLAAIGIETSYGDFRAEREGKADYHEMAAKGAEVISVDDVPAAADALDAANQLKVLRQSCSQSAD